MESSTLRRMARKLRLLAVGAGVLLFLMVSNEVWVASRPALPARPATQARPAASTGALPLAGARILVDAGHGGYDGGAKAHDSGVWEKEINLSVALKLRQALIAAGAEVLMTREEDIALCDASPRGITKKRQDMERRTALAVREKADMVLSIHMNEYRRRSSAGPQVFFREGQQEGKRLAAQLQAALIASVNPKKKREAQAGDYFILSLDIPSALVECGFLSNAEEEKKLLDKAYQQRLAEGICEGAANYWRERTAEED